MQKGVKIRLYTTLLSMLTIASGVYLILYSLENNITFFYPPSQLNDAVDMSSDIMVGGFVKSNSIDRVSINYIKFVLTDNISDIKVSYQGLLPSLFRENQGVVAKGKLQNNIFVASELLTKHDENYKPPHQ